MVIGSEVAPVRPHDWLKDGHATEVWQIRVFNPLVSGRFRDGHLIQ